MPRNMVLLLIEIPETLRIAESRWNPGDLGTSRQIGDEWLESKDTPVLRVPSALIPRQTNYLLNPEHPLFGAIQVIEITPFAFDRRLLSPATSPVI